jgi:hypothetical protein
MRIHPKARRVFQVTAISHPIKSDPSTALPWLVPESCDPTLHTLHVSTSRSHKTLPNRVLRSFYHKTIANQNQKGARRPARPLDPGPSARPKCVRNRRRGQERRGQHGATRGPPPRSRSPHHAHRPAGRAPAPPRPAPAGGSAARLRRAGQVQSMRRSTCSMTPSACPIELLSSLLFSLPLPLLFQVAAVPVRRSHAPYHYCSSARHG